MVAAMFPGHSAGAGGGGSRQHQCHHLFSWRHCEGERWEEWNARGIMYQEIMAGDPETEQNSQGQTKGSSS